MMIAACGRPHSVEHTVPDASVGDRDAAGSLDGPADGSTTSCPPLDDTPPPAHACTQDIDCAAHEVCLPSAQCGCAAGYSADASGACAWRGVVVDPAFSRDCGWLVSGMTDDNVSDVNIVPSAPGLVDPGEALFAAGNPDDPNNCPTAPLGLSQTVMMPRRSRAEPLVIEMTYRRDPISNLYLEPTIQIGASKHETPVSSNDAMWTQTRLCLGAGDYAPETSTGRGVDVTFTVSLTNPNVCLFDSAIFIDSVAIVPAHAGECP